MKKIIIILVTVAALSACADIGERKTESFYEQTSVVKGPAHVEHITAMVVRVGRYWYRDADATESGTVLIFDNGQIFKHSDKDKGVFACAVKEGDVLTYDRTIDGRITLTGFVVK